MKFLPRPLVKDEPNNRAFGRKLAKLIATMRRLPEPPVKAQAQPAITNGMTAYGKWDSMRGDETHRRRPGPEGDRLRL